MSHNNNIILDVAAIKNLPPLPEASIKIMTAVNDPDISIDTLVDVILLSPVLTARLLGVANSAYFGRSGEIKDLRAAIIQVLGLDLVKSFALSILLNVEFDTSKCQLFDAKYFWNHTLVTACIAQKLAKHFTHELMAHNTVYTSGLLLNIGLLAAIYIVPGQVNQVLAETDKTEGLVSEKMLELLGKTQYELGGILLEKWHIPSIYQTVVKEFRQTSFQGDEKPLIDLLELSHWIGAYVVTDKHEELPDYSELLNKLAISQEQMDSCIVDIVNNKDNIQELAIIMSK